MYRSRHAAPVCAALSFFAGLVAAEPGDAPATAERMYFLLKPGEYLDLASGEEPEAGNGSLHIAYSLKSRPLAFPPTQQMVVRFDDHSARWRWTYADDATEAQHRTIPVRGRGPYSFFCNGEQRTVYLDLLSDISGEEHNDRLLVLLVSEPAE